MKNAKKLSDRNRDPSLENQLEADYLVELKEVGLRPDDYEKEEHARNLRAYRDVRKANGTLEAVIVLDYDAHLGTLAQTLPVFGGDSTPEALDQTARNLRLLGSEHGDLLTPAQATLLAAELRRVETLADAARDRVLRVLAEPVPLLTGTTRAVDFLSNPKSRKMSLKRIADENADLQVPYAEGRYFVVLVRKVSLWTWMFNLWLADFSKPLLKLVAVLWARFVAIDPTGRCPCSRAR